MQTAERVDPAGVEGGDEERLTLAHQIEPVGPLPFEDARGVAVGGVGGEGVREVVPGDERDEGVDAGVDGGGGELHRAAVRAADHADARVAGAVAGDEVGAGAVVGGQGAGEEVDEPGGGAAVGLRSVERYQAAGLAEAEARVDEAHVAALGEGLADGVGGAVVLAAAEAVRGEDGGRGVLGVHSGRPVEVGVDGTTPAARLDGEPQRGHGVGAGGGLGAARGGGERQGRGERGRAGHEREDLAGSGHGTGHRDLHAEDDTGGTQSPTDW